MYGLLRVSGTQLAPGWLGMQYLTSTFLQATEPVRAVVDIDSAKRDRLSFRTQCLTVPEGKLLVDGTAVALLKGQTASTAPSGQA